MVTSKGIIIMIIYIVIIITIIIIIIIRLEGIINDLKIKIEKDNTR